MIIKFDVAALKHSNPEFQLSCNKNFLPAEGQIMSMPSKDVHIEINHEQMLSCIVILAQAYVL